MINKDLKHYRAPKRPPFFFTVIAAGVLAAVAFIQMWLILAIF